MGGMLACCFYLKGYIGRQLRGVTIPDAAMPSMKRAWLMLAALAAHIALTTYAAFALSKEWWGFISGGLLYILFAAVAIGQFASAKLRARRAAREARARRCFPSSMSRASSSERRPGASAIRDRQAPSVVHLQIVDGRGHVPAEAGGEQDIQPANGTAPSRPRIRREDLDAALSASCARSSESPSSP